MTRLIAIDWGTSRFRGYLVADGKIIDTVSSHEGMAATAKDAFAAVLQKNCAAWFAAHPQAPVTMAGMVGSRNGWMEVPYANCPAGVEDIARGAGKVFVADGKFASIIPGLICRNDGVPDVMRGEETLIIGTGVTDGAVILPGTHSKWARLEGGRVTSFRTYMTGEFFALLTQHSILRLLATEGAGRDGFDAGLDAAARGGGLTHAAFSARTKVLAGDLPGSAVAQYISGLLIGAEIREAARAGDGPVTLVADGVVGDNYRIALARAGIAAEVKTPDSCLVAGLAKLAAIVQ